MYKTDFRTLWEKARVGCFERTALKHVYYLGWNRSPAQVGCMRQMLGSGALGRPRGIGWRGRWEGGSGWGMHVNPWLMHVNVWQKPLQYCKVISLQLIKINGKKKKLAEKSWLMRSLKETALWDAGTLGVLLTVTCTHAHSMYVVSHSVVSDIFVTPWTVAPQAPLSIEFSRQEYWSG